MGHYIIIVVLGTAITGFILGVLFSKSVSAETSQAIAEVKGVLDRVHARLAAIESAAKGK